MHMHNIVHRLKTNLRDEKQARKLSEKIAFTVAKCLEKIHNPRLRAYKAQKTVVVRDQTYLITVTCTHKPVENAREGFDHLASYADHLHQYLLPDSAYGKCSNTNLWPYWKDGRYNYSTVTYHADSGWTMTICLVLVPVKVAA